MAWSSLASNQMVSFTDAQGGGFTLNAGQSNVTSNQCMTKSDALTKYNLSSSAMSSYASNQLVPKSAWVSAAVTSYSYTVKLGTTLSNVCSAIETVIFSYSSTWVVGMFFYSDSALTTYLTGFDYIVQSGSSDIYNLGDAEIDSVLGTDTGNNCVTSYSYTVKLGTTLANVCSAIETVVYSPSSTWVADMLLWDSASGGSVYPNEYIVQSGSNDIYNITFFDGLTNLGTDTGNNCSTATAYSVQLSTTLAGVCSAAPSIVYSDSDTFAVGMTLYTTSALTTLKTGFSYLLNDITTDIYILNSTTAVVGSDTGSDC